MKKIRLKKTLSYGSILTGLLIASCSQNQNTEDLIGEEINTVENLSIVSRTMGLANNEFDNDETIIAYSELMTEVLTMAKDPDFRNYVYNNAHELSESGNDYLVYVDDMTKKFSASSKFGKSSSKISEISAKIQSINENNIPMIFFPKAETLENLALSNKSFDVSKNMKEPIGVLKGAHNADYSAPGYKLNSKGKLEYAFDVDEEYAWNNDVYVIGEAEFLPEFDAISTKQVVDTKETMPFYSEKSINPSSAKVDFVRNNGEEEHGAWIQVTDLNGIESWFSGKLEMRQIVSGIRGGGATVIADTPFGRVSRSTFKDEKWVKFNASFLFTWNLSNIADYNIEKWMEIDGGSTVTNTISIPGSQYKPATSTTPAQPAIPGSSVSITSKRDDDDLGTRMVQFSENRYKRYNIGKMTFIRYEGN